MADRPTIKLALLLCLAACTKPPSVPVVAVPTSLPTPVADTLGTVGDFRPDVVVRRHRELEWRGVDLGLALYAYDAVQTRDGAKARLELVNGSRLELAENALVILTPSLVDRAVVRRGRFKGETTGELWILTSAALLRLVPDKSGKKASVRVQVDEGKRLRVELASGRAVIEREHFPPIAVVQSKSVEVVAPAATDTFGTESVTAWEKARPSVVDVLASVPTPSPAVRAPAAVTPMGELSILAPGNYSEVSGDKAVVRGRLSSGKASILVNGAAAILDASGAFEATVVVKPGPNSILIQAVGADGTSRFRRWTLMGK